MPGRGRSAATRRRRPLRSQCSGLHQALHDLECVVHLHTTYGTAVAVGARSFC
ncbi:class II aldolase/adducin family protein [Paraburkholderia sp. BR14263]|uniref:class II aldolase/adducin family protein n=1 Tax=unclassified Paraburkholderia TaxID=2615204 RepID=UPI0034CF5E48